MIVIIYVDDILIYCKSEDEINNFICQMKTEYVALSASCCDLFPMIDVTNEICAALHLTLSDTTEMHVKIHEDNVGTLILGKLSHGG